MIAGHYRHGTICRSHEILGDRAFDDARKPRSVSRTDDNQVRAHALAVVGNGFRDTSVARARLGYPIVDFFDFDEQVRKLITARRSEPCNCAATAIPNAAEIEVLECPVPKVS